MDQPTNLNITIKGKSDDVKRSALIAQRRIDLDTRGFKEEAYVFGDGINFETKIKGTVGISGDWDFNFEEAEDGTAVFTTEQESYGCIEEEDIVEIAKDIIKDLPDVEIHISACITIYDECDVCVDVDYVNGELKVDTSEEYYDDEEDDEDYEDEKSDDAGHLPDGYMEALEMFMKAEELGAPKAKRGEVFSSEGTFDIVIAKAEEGDSEAKFTAGKYFLADHITEETDRAIRWIKEAAEAGVEDANEYIASHKELF